MIPDRYDEITKRIDFFQHLADITKNRLLRNDENVGLRVDSGLIKYAATCYFSVSDAYKDRFLEYGHRTEEGKIAGVSVATLMSIEPFYCEGPTESINLVYVNAWFSFFCACSILEIKFNKIPDGFLMRHFNCSLKNISLDGLANIQNAYQTPNGEVYELDSDKEKINLSVRDFGEISKLTDVYDLLKMNAPRFKHN